MHIAYLILQPYSILAPETVQAILGPLIVHTFAGKET